MEKKTNLLFMIFIICMVSINAQVNIDSGLVAYYPFNGNAIDESGNGNHGVVNGAVLSHDRFGNPDAAFWFNGTNSYISVPDNDILDIISEISIAAWIKKDTNIAWASIVTKGDSIAHENNYTLHNSEIGSVVFTSDNSIGVGGGVSNGSIAIPNDEWHFVVFTWDGITGKIYIDAVLDILSIIEMPGEFLPNNCNLFIGLDSPGLVEYFAGQLDEIRLYNRWLTEDEIQYLYEYSLEIDGPEDISNINVEVFPNPFCDYTNIRLNTSACTDVNISVYDFAGQVIKVIADEVFCRGEKLLIWDGSNETGMMLPSGIYILKVRSSKKSLSSMMILTR